MNHSSACRDTTSFSPRLTTSQEEPARVTAQLAQGRTVTAMAPCARLVTDPSQPVPVAPVRKPGPDLLAPAWFEPLIPGPKEDVAGLLKPDAYLKGTSTGFRLDYATYQREAAIRVRMEEEGEGDNYTFEPFMTLLDNMRQVALHFLADRQFEEALTDDEHRAFVAVLDHIQEMERLGAPYKRTVWLAVLFATLHEIVSGRHVIDGLREDARKLWEKERVEEFAFYPRNAAGQIPCRRLACQQIDLDRVLACRWGGLNPQGELDEYEELFDGGSCIHHHLKERLDTPALFLCPSFEPLDLPDFCRFGHLPVYPLGLITCPAVNADGVMHTPLTFLDHDLEHTGTLRGWDPDPYSETLFGSPPGRERFRFLVLDSLPAALGHIKPALTLIAFYLLHEVSPGQAWTQMKEDHSGRLLHSLGKVRRVHRWDLPVAYQRTTDQEAWLACHWAHGLYRQLAEDPEARRPAEDLIGQCLAQTLPQAQEQWRFFEAHRAAIGDWFRSREETQEARDGGLHHQIQCKSEWCYWHFSGGLVPFWEDYNKRCEGPVDYTDVAYLAVLHDPETRELMMQALT